MTKKSKGKIILSHYSALVMIRYARILGAKFIKCEDDEILHNARRPNYDEVMFLSQFIKKQTDKLYKVDVLVDVVAKKYNSRLLSCHSCTVDLSGKYFCKIVSNDDVLNSVLFNNFVVVCPELAILQLSRIVPAWRLLQWMIELMGNYVIDKKSKNGFFECKPILSNINELQRLICNFSNNNMGHRLGNKKILQQCIKYVECGSASPRETILYILLCGPRILGFFQTHRFVFNKKILLSNEAARLCGQDIVIPDLSYPKKKIAIEYDSKIFHENSFQDQKDKRRFIALEHDGWKVFTITPYQMKNYMSFYQIALDVLKACDQDCRIKSLKFHKYNRENFYALLC